MARLNYQFPCLDVARQANGINRLVQPCLLVVSVVANRKLGSKCIHGAYVVGVAVAAASTRIGILGSVAKLISAKIRPQHPASLQEAASLLPIHKACKRWNVRADQLTKPSEDGFFEAEIFALVVAAWYAFVIHGADVFVTPWSFTVTSFGVKVPTQLARLKNVIDPARIVGVATALCFHLMAVTPVEISKVVVDCHFSGSTS